jgi:hypothetical protein
MKMTARVQPLKISIKTSNGQSTFSISRLFETYADVCSLDINVSYSELDYIDQIQDVSLSTNMNSQRQNTESPAQKIVFQ